MKLGYIGLGKMGLNMVERLIEAGHDCVVTNDRNEEARTQATEAGATSAQSLETMIEGLPTPRTVWLMVPHSAVDEVLQKIIPLLDEGDTVIDGGNSFFKDSIRRGEELRSKNINYLDAGVSGGPGGARNGACIMVGGEKEVFDRYESLFKDLSAPEAYGYMGPQGAGHFVKMVHNGIEYGMMQAIAEGFDLMRSQKRYDLDLQEVARVYNHQSVITSRLVGWLEEGYRTYGQDLEKITSTVGHTGEGAWTVDIAHEENVPLPVIEASLEFRKRSGENPSYTGKVLSSLRNMFGGHAAK